MGFEVDIIKALQTLSDGFTDFVGKALSLFGTEYLFLAVAVTLYWCIDKAYAYRFFNVYILGVAVTNFFKQGFKRPRPFNAYPDAVRSIGAPETTYSFPSGHTESIASVSTLLTIKYGKKHKAVPIVFAVLTLLVMLSRMYLGQHYLSDVFCGLTLGMLVAIVFNAQLSLFGSREELFLIPALIMSAVVIGVMYGTGMANGASGADLLKGLGAFSAFDIGYFLEKKFVKYDVAKGRKLWKCALRIILGGGVAVAVQQTFKLFLPSGIPMLYGFLRYFIMAFWAAFVAPLIFKAVKL